MKLSFMTWVCPDWDLNQILTAAIRYGYDSVEPRPESKQKHGIEVETNKRERKAIRQAFEDTGVGMSCIATSCRYALADSKQRKEMVSTAKRFIELANDLGCPYLRVFGGMTPEGMDFSDAKKYVVEGLRLSAEAAEGTDVILCIETHDAYCLANDLIDVVKAVDHENAKVCWDILHPVTHGMTMGEAFEYVKDYVRHVHIHDAKIVAGQRTDMALTGEGNIAHDEAVKLLAGIGYEGALSGEWINAFPPEEILPQSADMMRKYISEAGN